MEAVGLSDGVALATAFTPAPDEPHSTAPSVDDDIVTSWGLVVEGFSATTRLLRDDLDEALQIPLAWMDVLLRLLRTPGHRLTMSELAAQTSMTTSGFTRMADRLTRAGLLERQPCESDRRVIRAALTPAGLALAARARAAHATHLRSRVLATLGPDDLAQLSRLMRTLRDAGCPQAELAAATSEAEDELACGGGDPAGDATV